MVVADDIGAVKLPQIDKNYILDCLSDGTIDNVKGD